MDIPKDIFNEVCKDILGEFDEIAGNDKMPETLDEIEGVSHKFGKEFEKRIIEKFIESKHNKIKVKKNA